MTQAPTTGTSSPGPHGAPGGSAGAPPDVHPGRSHRRRLGAGALRVVIVLLALLLLASVVTAGVLARKAAAADDRAQDRTDAANVASQFALRMDEIDGADFDGYIKGVNELLTTKARTENRKVFETIEPSYQAAKVKGTGKVLLTAVGDVDDDSATILVVHDADVTTTQGKLEHHYRWTVNTVKVDDKWLVDDFSPVS